MKKQTKPIKRAACFILLASISTLPIFLYAYGKGSWGKDETVSSGDALQTGESIETDDVLPKEAPVVMPDVVGMSVEEAAAALTEAGLLYEISWEEAAGEAEMIVLSQEPEPGTELSYKAWVTIAANGVEAPEAQDGVSYSNQLQMPFVYGKQLQDAVLTITEAGLEIGSIENVYDWDEAIYQAGQIFETFPAPGELVESGGKVNLSVCGARS